MDNTGSIRWLSRGRKLRQQRFGENTGAANAAANRFGGGGVAEAEIDDRGTPSALSPLSQPIAFVSTPIHWI